MAERARILIVDDSVENRLLLKVFLKSQPLRVYEAVDGMEAVEQVLAGPFALVLMDINMPVLDGLEATRRIRSRERELGRAHTPILALTADDTDADRARSAEAGCDEHLVKPLSRDTLRQVLERWLPAT
jgi:CheY-like chemotaxis protein